MLFELYSPMEDFGRFVNDPTVSDDVVFVLYKRLIEEMIQEKDTKLSQDSEATFTTASVILFGTIRNSSLREKLINENRDYAPWQEARRQYHLLPPESLKKTA